MTGTSARGAGGRRVVPVRHYGQWVGIAVIAALAALLVWQVALNSVIRWDLVFSRLGAEAIMEGALVTVVLTVIAMVLGVALGVVVAVMRISGNPVLATVAWVFVWVFRGTPLLVQVLVWFNLALFLPEIGVGSFSIPLNTISPFAAALIALTLNEAAYMSEIVRGGLLSVDPGQQEAAGALGMTPAQTLRRVVLPQAMRAILPPTGNELVTLLKETSLVSVIGAGDLLYRARQIGAADFSLMEMLLVASVWYLALTSVASVLQAWLERRFDPGARASGSGFAARMFGFRNTERAAAPAEKTGEHA
ncbi:amino acid ABC transporter permease [Microbacterium sp. ZXX196]|uniref:amino acid ABC transporter permease n=1 Tax=Microbacterium sp. ZXX196 TaxID=2609291 RepID=UPI0012B94228|nr:ABC transporter permease subunit [Microbacterium sp. ZXX196]